MDDLLEIGKQEKKSGSTQLIALQAFPRHQRNALSKCLEICIITTR